MLVNGSRVGVIGGSIAGCCEVGAVYNVDISAMACACAVATIGVDY